MKTRTGFPTFGCVVLAWLPALWPVSAQTPVPSGSYGFLVIANQMDTAGWTGGAGVGVMNIDDQGSVTGTITFQGRDTVDPASQLGNVTFRGTYANGSDGVGTLEMTFEDGFKIAFAVVTSDGGQTLRFISPASGAFSVVLSGSNQSLTAALPAGVLVEGADGFMTPFPVRRSEAPGATVFTGSSEPASGKAACVDGKTYDWTAGVENLTVAAVPAGNGQSLTGNYLLTGYRKSCGRNFADFITLSGLATGSFTPTGLRLTLRGNGVILSGTAKAIKGVSLNGAYALQTDFSPFPGGNVGVMTFDGNGGVSATFATPGNGEFSTAKLTGTYSVDGGGSGKINFNTAAGEPGGPTYSIAVVDDGAGFLFLRTRANPGGSVAFGAARLQ